MVAYGESRNMAPNLANVGDDGRAIDCVGTREDGGFSLRQKLNAAVQTPARSGSECAHRSSAPASVSGTSPTTFDTRRNKLRVLGSCAAL